MRKKLKLAKVAGRCALTDSAEGTDESETDTATEKFLFYACMAPQSCVMNPAQGSPPSVAAGESAPEDKAAGETEELDLSPVRRCKNKTHNLPFSVESLISERTPERSRFSPDRRQGCVRSGETECASPRGLYDSNQETLELRDQEVDHWSHTAHTSPPSEYEPLTVWFHFDPGSGNLPEAFCTVRKLKELDHS